MLTRFRYFGFFLLLSGLTTVSTGVATAQEAHSVKLGEAALRFAGGSIQQTVAHHGIVNLITGDNQITGNRMVLGWAGSDVLYLRLSPTESAAPGDLYTVYRRVHKVFHPRTRTYLGYLVNRLAVVRVIEVNQHLATVQIVRAFNSISPGDAVERFTPPVPDEVDPVAEPPAALEGMIVDLQSDKAMSLVGQGNLVYMDRGRADGLRVGDHLEVDRLGSGLPPRRIAEVRILSVEDHTATAVITKSISRVLIGDRVQYKGHATPDDPRYSQEEPLTPSRPMLATPHRAVSPATKGNAEVKIHTVPIPGGVGINIDDLVEQLEYESGHVTIRPAGEPILVQIADYLKANSSSQLIRIEGHADDMEIGPSLKPVYASNWELSRARATTIVRYLIEKGGIDSAKLSAVGYGASRPVATNATAEGRKQNRRIEIVLYTSDPSSPASEAMSPPQHDHKPALSEQAAVRPAPAAMSLHPEAAQPADHPTPMSSEGMVDISSSQIPPSTDATQPSQNPVSEPATPSPAL